MTYSDSSEQSYGLSQYQQIAFLKYCWELDSVEPGFLEQYFLEATHLNVGNEPVDQFNVDQFNVGQFNVDQFNTEFSDAALEETLYEILEDMFYRNLRPQLLQLDETRSSRSQVKGQLRCTLSELWMPLGWFYAGGN
jgi:hypothetical protein